MHFRGQGCYDLVYLMQVLSPQQLSVPEVRVIPAHGQGMQHLNILPGSILPMLVQKIALQGVHLLFDAREAPFCELDASKEGSGETGNHDN